MAETQPRPQLVRFGAFEADLRTGELRKDGVKLKFGGQPLQVLTILLERPGDLVTREELQKRLWPDTFVDVDHNLNTAINKIREVLGDSAENPRFVETLPRRGYRFVGPVSGPQTNGKADAGFSVDVAASLSARIEREKPSTAITKPRNSQPIFWVLVGLGAIAVAGLVIGMVLYLRGPLPTLRIASF